MAERPSDLLPPRWYMVNKYGAATLCVDKRDALDNARAADGQFPRDAPHVAAQLAPVRTLDAAPLASGPTHDRSGIVAQLLDSANIRELPNWVRVLMQRAADALDAAPSEPSAECWRRAMVDYIGDSMKPKHMDWIEQRARALSQENNRGT